MRHTTRALELADFCFREPEERLVFFADEVLGPALREDLSSICRRIVERHRLPKRNTKTTVVHYMSLSTLYTIVRSELEWKSNQEDTVPPCYRLYDSNHFNDPEEGTYLLRKLPDQHVWLRRLSTALDTRGAYISSFILPHSTSDNAIDNLVFWRTYGDEGSGCSLSLRVNTKKLKRVHYDTDEISKTLGDLEPILKSVLPLVEKSNGLSDSLRDGFQGSLARQICDSLDSIRYLYKSRAYKYEQECRIVRTEAPAPPEPSDIHYSYQAHGNLKSIRHYCTDSDLLVGRMLESGTVVTIGPCVQKQRDVSRSMATLCKRAGLGCEVRASKIQYRRAM